VAKGQTLTLTEVVSFTALSDSYFIMIGDKGGTIEATYIWPKDAPEKGSYYAKTEALKPQSWYVVEAGYVEIQSTEAGIKGVLRLSDTDTLFNKICSYLFFGLILLAGLWKIFGVGKKNKQE
jgi:hypothetical protein